VAQQKEPGGYARRVMRRRLYAAALVVPLVLVTPAAAQAKAPKIVAYQNCAAVHQHYNGGIAKVGAKDKRKGGGHAKYKPYVSTALYAANVTMDRDHDGIACEQ
jgi:Excalibur calcium-binding domain